jgi:GntR family transcriptional repressor for pyruvate dehydrogenase complex
MILERVSLRLRIPEAIVHQIEHKILAGEKAGQNLPPENELIKQFGMDRNTVREALRILETSGVVKVKRGSQEGPVITNLTDEFISDFLTKAIRLGGVSPDHLCEFRLAVEPSITEMVAVKKDINPQVLLQMEDNILEVNALYKTKQVTAYRNMGFHVLIAMATENPMFVIILKTLRVGLNLVLPPRIKSRFKRSNITREFWRRSRTGIRLR